MRSSTADRRGRQWLRALPELVRDWRVVRMLHNAMWCVEVKPAGLDDDAQQYLGMCLSLAEEMAD
ncbi:MAG: hypothetical protein H0U28_08580 [Nocardioidaceae bacterium]|nr:hypothetical protein [Nocardioidaceae bacterium]